MKYVVEIRAVIAHCGKDSKSVFCHIINSHICAGRNAEQGE